MIIMKNWKILKERRWFIPVVLIGIIVVAGLVILSAYKTPVYVQPTNHGPAYQEQEIEEGVKTWIKAFERYGNQVVYSIQQTSDGGYIAAGTFGRNGTGTPTGHQRPDVYLLKLDSDGNITWEKTIGAGKGSIAHDVQQTRDGGYIVAGVTMGYFDLGTDWDVYLVKTDESGNKMWEKGFYLFGIVSENDYAWSVQQTSDGGYIVGGRTNAFLSANRLGEAFLLKTDAYGNKTWEKNYGGNDFEDTRSAQQTSDGGYIIAGDTEPWNSAKPEDTNAYLVKTDADGNKLWERAIDAFDKHEQDGASSIQQTSDGGYILAGHTASVDASRSPYPYLLKVDKDGNKVWENTYTGQGGGLASVQQTSDGGYIATGVGSYSDEDANDAYLLKTDASGGKMWEKHFRRNETYYYEPGGNHGRSVQQTSDGGYIIAAEAYTANPWQSDILLIKTDGNGNVYGYKR